MLHNHLSIIRDYSRFFNLGQETTFSKHMIILTLWTSYIYPHIPSPPSNIQIKFATPLDIANVLRGEDADLFWNDPIV